ncbi:S8 family serine peptidase [Streptomyces sp. NPDC048258]|uniref:S8 family serine peptidase n=1 Tax=Streptomyces sp. NPDC048258 TaxID=3365527 RepID=UPI003710916D
MRAAPVEALGGAGAAHPCRQCTPSGSSFHAPARTSGHRRCVSLYAPGQAIVSAKLGGGSVALDGTSMAAPHVAGIAALYKQAHPTATPAEINEFIDDESSKDVLNSISPASPNKLLFTSGL